MDSMNNTNQNNQQMYGNDMSGQQQYNNDMSNQQQAQQSGYIQTPGAQQNYQQDYQQNYQQGYQGYQQTQIPQGQAMDNKYMTWLIAGIVQVLSMCCCSWWTAIAGIITIVMAIMANQSYNFNDRLGYEKKINIAKWANIVGWVLLVLGLAISLVTGILSKLINMIVK